jgi:2,4-dienoyl-CoA reductase-like NADH-dependent reductase (Old Yellow Enzyme family)
MDTTRTDPLLEPFRLKHLTLRNRVMSTSHACGLGDAEHMPAEAYQAYHVEKARGGLALTMFGGSSYVSNDSKWAGGQLSVATDAVIPHFQRFAERIHAEGAALMVQITHLGRRAETNTQAWLPTVAPSAVRERGHRSIPRVIDRADIDRIVRDFGDAAVRCKEGGLDGLEVMTHGHLIGQFFSPETNKRTDDFGGSAENRARFGLMVLEEIRRRVGPDFPVGLRYAVDEGMKGGQDFDDCLAILKLFEDRGLIDFVNANYGRLDTELAMVIDCMPGMQERQAPWLEKAAAFKREIGLPVFHAAKINDIATARHAIRDGLLDMVAMTRAHIADPQIVAKLLRGEEDRIRPCVGAVHCMGENRPTCLHNPASGRERFWPQVIEKTKGPVRKVVVVGGGPAGLEAARISAERGHSVVLFEAANALGGQLRLADTASWRRDVASIIAWREQELDHLGVDVRLNTFAERDEILAESPDVVIMATGGIPDFSLIEGGELCTSAWDVLGGSAQTGEDVVIFDGTGRHPAPTAAEMLARQGKRVSLYMVDDVPAKELAYGERAVWKKRLAEEGIAPVGDHTLVAVERAGNGLAATFVNDLTGASTRVEAATVVVESGVLPMDEAFESVRADSANGGAMDLDALTEGRPQPALDEDGFALFRIGDAAGSRNVQAAMFDALRLCCRL